MEAFSTAALTAVVGVDTNGVLCTGIVHTARVLTHPTDTSFSDPTVLVHMAHHYRVDRKSQEKVKSRIQSMLQLSQERVQIALNVNIQLYNVYTTTTVDTTFFSNQKHKLYLHV